MVSKEVMSEKAATTVRNAYSVGKKKCSDFIKERLCNSDDQRIPIYATVKKKRLAFFRSESIVTVPKVKRETTALKERCTQACMWAANQGRRVLPPRKSFSPSLPDYGSICKPTSKADFLKCLPQFTDDSNKETFEKYEAPSVDDCITDGAALLQMNNM